MSKRKAADFFDDGDDLLMTSRAPIKKCYETHPALPVGEFKVYGGSCGHPIVKDADVYVGLDLGMAKSVKSYPWEHGDSFLFYIADMHAPTDPAQFKKLIEWLAVQLAASKKVHVGCLGGHGRTGTVLSALVSYMTGEVDAITYVRKHYCIKAVESAEQVDFLVKHFGVKKVQGHKEYTSTTTGRYSSAHGNVVNIPKAADLPSGLRDVVPMQNPMAIWGDDVTLDKPDDSGIITL